MKFLVSPSVAEQVHQWSMTRLLPDPNGAGGDDGYGITSLYFDTPEFDVFHRNGSYGRSKYRIRKYGEEQVVFLERKLRTKGLLCKRRTVIPDSELQLLSGSEVPPGWGGFWFHMRMTIRRLKPICQIHYERSARVSMTKSGPIRLTLDRNLKALPLETLGFVEGTQGERFLRDSVILELKFRGDMPGVFKMLIEKFTLEPRSFSKYRVAVSELGLVEEEARLNLENPAKFPASCPSS